MDHICNYLMTTRPKKCEQK